MIPPHLMKQMGGAGAIQNLMKQFTSGNMKLPEGFPSGFPGFG